MSTKLRIASLILQSALPYKYTVYSPKTRNTKDRDQVYEFIDSEHKAIMNRVLQPIKEFEQRKGTVFLTSIKFLQTMFVNIMNELKFAVYMNFLGCKVFTFEERNFMHYFTSVLQCVT